MLENFDAIPNGTPPSPILECPAMPFDIFDPPAGHHKPKRKKSARKVLKQVERERDQLLYVNGQLALENEMMKRAMALAIATSRRQFDDDLSEDALRLLPPRRKGRRR